MQGSSISTFDRRFSWVAAVFLGLGGIWDLVSGLSKGNTGEAVYGLGKALCGVFFLLHAWEPARLRNPRAQSMVAALLYVGLPIAIFGFLLKRGIL